MGIIVAVSTLGERGCKSVSRRRRSQAPPGVGLVEVPLIDRSDRPAVVVFATAAVIARLRLEAEWPDDDQESVLMDEEDRRSLKKAGRECDDRGFSLK